MKIIMQILFSGTTRTISFFMLLFYIFVGSLNGEESSSAMVSVNLTSQSISGDLIVFISIRNNLKHAIWIDEFNLCSSGYMSSQLLRVKAMKNDVVLGDVGYKGLIIDRINDRALENFKKIDSKKVVNCNIRLEQFYSLKKHFDSYEVQFVRKNYAYGDKQPEFIMRSKKLIIKAR